MGWTGVIAPPLAFLVPLLGIPFSWLTGFLLQRGVVRLGLPLVFVAPLAIVLRRGAPRPGAARALVGVDRLQPVAVARPRAARVGRPRAPRLARSCSLVNAGIATAIVRWRAGAPRHARLSAGPARRWDRPRGGRRPAPAGLHRGRPQPQEGPLAAGSSRTSPSASGCAQGPREPLRQPPDPRAAPRRDWSRGASGVEPDLLVWSETSFCPVARARRSARELLDGHGWPIRKRPGGRRADSGPRPPGAGPGDDPRARSGGTGVPTPEKRGGPRDDDGDGFDETNVAWVVRGGRPTDVVYDKRGLAPFGEYIPLPRGLPRPRAS